MNKLNLNNNFAFRTGMNYVMSRNLLDKPTEFGGARCGVIFFMDWNTPPKKRRTALPAEISNSWIQWFKHGNCHNIYGPVFIGFDFGTIEYWINDDHMPKSQWESERLKYVTEEFNE